MLKNWLKYGGVHQTTVLCLMYTSKTYRSTNNRSINVVLPSFEICIFNGVTWFTQDSLPIN